MKRVIFSLLLFIFALLPNILITRASEVTFFDALVNLASVEDHKALQSFYGHFEIEDQWSEDHMSVRYRVSFNSAVDGDADAPSSFSRVSAYLKLYNHNEPSEMGIPFKEMTFQVNGELKGIGQEDLYMKLTNFNVNMVEPQPSIVSDIEEMQAAALLYKGTWFHVNAASLMGSEYAEIDEAEFEKYMSFEDDFKEDPQVAILDLVELSLTESDNEFGPSEEEIDQILSGIGLFLEAKLFNIRPIVSGRNTGFMFFSLNKSALIELLEDIGEVIDEELTETDREVIRSGLSKTSLSGIYRINPDHEMLDNLFLRFKLREMESLKNMEFNYRMKVTDIDGENSIKAPTEFEELEAVGFSGF